MSSLIRAATMSLILSAVAFACQSSALAQVPYSGPGTPPPAAPTVSPYLNLLRRGSSPGVNYYGLVKPELEFRNAYRGLQQQADSQQLGQASDRRTGLPETGHPAVFLNTQGYFLNAAPAFSQRSGGMSAPGAGQQASPARKR